MFKKLSWTVLLLSLSIQITGCQSAAFLAGGAAGAGGVMYVRGKLQEKLAAPVPKVHQATIAALKELELPVEKDKKDKLTAKIESQFADGKPIWIDIHSIAKSSTKITIRVGTFGDELRSNRLLDTIRSHI
ncbi:MAG: DUF3568 family protein [Desulfobacterales bacterium]|nr:DUF3568 family protein [Desulfobacterales bacterium]